MLTALLTAVLMSGEPAAEPVMTDTVMSNSLRVVVQEIHYSPVVAVAVAYGVGSLYEADGARGMSHFCEHMMFRGTASMPGERLWQVVQRDGGWANAFTSNDVTLYFEVLPSSRLVDALAIESDRMQGALFDSSDAVAERNVILDELRMSSMDDPDGVLYDALSRAAFTVHPYRHPVIGYEGDVALFDSVAATDYYRSFYTPDNATLVIVGDVDTGRALAMADSLFGAIPPGDRHAPVIPAEPAQTEPALVEVSHPSAMARIAIGFHVPEATSEDDAELGLISTLLSEGRSSWLEQALVQEGLASEAWAYDGAGVDPGLFIIGATLMPGVGFEEAESAVWRLLDSLATDPLPGDVLETLRNRARAGSVLEESSPVGRAINLAYNGSCYLDPAFGDRRLEETMQVTPQDITGAAARYFRRENSTTARLEPTGSGDMAERPRESLPVDIQAPSDISYDGLDIPASMLTPSGRSVSDGAVATTLPNGLSLIVSEDHTFEVVSVAFSVPMGSLTCPAGKAGMAGLAAAAMLYGTGDLDYAAFNGRLEDEGSYMEFRPGDEFASGSVTALSEDLPLVMESVSDLLIRPALRDADIETCREEMAAGVRQRGESVFLVAMDQLDRMMLADPAEARIVTGETLGAISNDDVREFHRLCCRPGGAVLVIAGDVTYDTALALAEEWFGGWESPSDPLPVMATPALSTLPGDTAVVSMPGRVQAAVLAGVPGPALETPLYDAFTAMNGILGAGIGSRLGHSVRDEQGLAYDVGSWNRASLDAGFFTAYLSTRADYAQQALGSVILECARMASGDVEPIELDLQKAMTVGESAMSGTTYGERASALVRTAAIGLPLGYDRIREERVLALSVDDLRRAAGEYFGAGEWFVSVAGGLSEDMEPLSN